MDQPVGRTTRLRLYPIQPIWSPGAGWAAISGGLAAGGFAFEPETLLKLLLVWLLADPILGVFWDAGVRIDSTTIQRSAWRRLLSPRLPARAPPARLLPYTQTDSVGHRLARRLGRLSRWWRTSFWPETRHEFAALVASLGLALLLGAVLGRKVLVLALISILFSWLAVLTDRMDTPQDSDQTTTGQSGIVTLWRALGEFGIPWLIGVLAIGSPSWNAILLGVCYTSVFYGVIQRGGGFRLIAAGQGTAALLLAGLRHPIASGVMSIMLISQWGLRIWGDSQSGNQPTVHGNYRRYLHPFVTMSALIGALAVAS